MKQKIYEIDSIDGYNKWYGVETLHPLVTVIDIKESPEWLNGATLRYGLYGIFLKQGAGCSVRYGREKYDYQEGTIVTHAPGEVFTVEWNQDLPTVAYFADKACLSPNYFGDLISKESGTTAQRHIQDAVIERSKQLLIESRLPVSEIAYQLGFEYPQHFSRLFKSRTGMTPNAYRLTA